MDKEQAQKEIIRLNKITEGISPEYLRLQGLLNAIANKVQYCQGIIDDKPVQTTDEAIISAEKEFVKLVEALAEPVPIDKETPAVPQ